MIVSFSQPLSFSVLGQWALGDNTECQGHWKAWDGTSISPHSDGGHRTTQYLWYLKQRLGVVFRDSSAPLIFSLTLPTTWTSGVKCGPTLVTPVLGTSRGRTVQSREAGDVGPNAGSPH